MRKNTSLQGLFLVLFVCVLVTLPLANSYFTGAADSKYYLNLLSDFLNQFRSGVFPVYVGQTGHNFNGSINVVRFPYFFILGAMIDVFTLHRLNFVLIQHLIAIFSVFSGALVLYCLLLIIDRKRSLQAAFLSNLVILCPGIIGTIYTHDMYASITSLGPSTAIVGILALILTKNYHPFHYISLGAALSIAWMAHPPIALWITTSVSIFSLFLLAITREKKTILKGFILTGFAFSTLSLWYFITLFTTGGLSGTQHVHSSKIFSFLDSEVVKFITNTGLEIHYDGAFKPIPTSGPFNLSGGVQLGYSLWFIFILSSYTIFKKRDWRLLPLFLPFTILTFYLYPPAGVRDSIWGYLPNVYSITLYPYQRFFYILAPLAAVLFFLSQRVAPDANTKKSTEKIYLLMLCVLLLWSYQQTLRFREWFAVQLPTNSTDKLIKTQLAMSLTRPENVNIQTDTGQRHREIDFFFDPQLHNRVLNSEGEGTNIDNTEWLANHCESPEKTMHTDRSLRIGKKLIGQSDTFAMQSGPKYISEDFLSLDLPPHQGVAVFFLPKLNNFYLNLSIRSDQLLREYNDISEQTSKSLNFIPLWTTSENTVPIKLIANHFCKNEDTKCDGELKNICFAKYSNRTLPIKLDSIFPYQARVGSPRDGLVLETHRKYVKGYLVRVNSRLTSYVKTSSDYLGVPLVKGDNTVTLQYAGTAAMKISFIVSCLGWILFFGYCIRIKKEELRQKLSLKNSLL